jgi:hypothetical protein
MRRPAGAVHCVLLAKNAYANIAGGGKRIQPAKWLAGGCLSSGQPVDRRRVGVAINAPKFMAPLIIGPLTLIGLIVALVLMLLFFPK